MVERKRTWLMRSLAVLPLLSDISSETLSQWTVPPIQGLPLRVLLRITDIMSFTSPGVTAISPPEAELSPLVASDFLDAISAVVGIE